MICSIWKRYPCLVFDRKRIQFEGAGNQKSQNLRPLTSQYTPRFHLYRSLDYVPSNSCFMIRSTNISGPMIPVYLLYEPFPAWYFSRIWRIQRRPPLWKLKPTISKNRTNDQGTKIFSRRLQFLFRCRIGWLKLQHDY